jgi:hypothetical protein
MAGTSPAMTQCVIWPRPNLTPERCGTARGPSCRCFPGTGRAGRSAGLTSIAEGPSQGVKLGLSAFLVQTVVRYPRLKRARRGNARADQYVEAFSEIVADRGQRSRSGRVVG